MTGTNASLLQPLPVGQSDSGDFSSYLGRPVQVGDETYVMVQCGAAIAASSQGKQLVTALSSGVASWVVALATGLADSLNCGAIPSTLTAAIASGAYFLALRDSAQHVMLVRGTATGTIAVGGSLCTGSGSDLINILTGASSASVTGTTLQIEQFANRSGRALTADTGVAAVTGSVAYRAPYRQG
jgi:hypothetical protein